ncbi:TetR family transcriptional regulator [Sphingomonas sp. PP-CC-3G-468]|nr:TetR family transcriptional regulator [Sphingomonas sp. PP-CC-3G-468]
MDTAAGLYASKGFLGASVAEIAAACQTSKSLIYHYYPSKEDILFDVMDSHVQSLVEAARAIDNTESDPVAKVHRIAAALMALYAGHEANQKVLLNELGNLPADRRAIIIDHQRQLLDLLDTVLLALRPDLADDKARRRTLVMMLFGMLNWTHTWFNPAGAIKNHEIAEMASSMFLAGLDCGTPTPAAP